MTKPLISVCVPTYNQTRFLERLLISLSEQDFNDYELIVSDDSTTDDVGNMVCVQYGHLFQGRLKYQRNTPGLGSPRNWNEAISLAESDIIKLIHHDEFFSFPHSLRRFYEICISQGPGSIVFSGGFTLDHGRQETKNHSITPDQLNTIRSKPELLLFANLLGSPGGLCYMRNDETYDVHLKWLVDVEFYIRLLKKNKLFYIDEPLVSTVINADHNITNACKDNRNVEIPECVHIYYKFSRLGFVNLMNAFWYLRNLTRLMYVYGIFSSAELASIPLQGKWPFLFKMAVASARVKYMLRKT